MNKKKTVRVYFKVAPKTLTGSFSPSGYSQYYKNGLKYGLEEAKAHRLELLNSRYEGKLEYTPEDLVIVKETVIEEIVV